MVSRPLYLFSQFFEDKAIEKLNRTGINSEYLNDDQIGLLMDDIYKLGLTNLFIEIGLLVIKKFKVETILFIMSLCLLVYNLGQRELRNTLL
jgi:transposase